MPAKTVTVVDSLEDLEDRVRAGHHTFAILLAGGLAYSRKTIRRGRGRRWIVKNHIDDTTQTLTSEQLWTESNIGIALERRALVQLEGGRTIAGSVEA